VTPNVVLVSDLHLAGGGMADDRVVDPGGAFARFLGDLGRRAADQQRPVRLVILGDFLELPRFDPAAAGLADRAGFEQAVTLGLERIAVGHPEVFGALADLVSGGSAVDIVPGNHDIALLHRSAQERLRELLAAAVGDGVRARIAFHPWIYHQPGVLYAEHGHQYHDLNAVPLLLASWSAEDPSLLYRPPAFELESYRAAARSSPNAAGQRLCYLVALLGQVLALSSPRFARQRAAYRQRILHGYAEQVGIAHRALVAIDQLSEATAWSIAWRLTRTWLVTPAVRALPAQARSPRSAWLASNRAAYLHRAWPAIHAALEAEGQAVPFYIFGHTHLAEKRQLPGGRVCYLNTGTWSPAVPPPPAPGRFTFVEVTHGSPARGPVARLLRWDDNERRPEAVAE
jgi:UDP-2,3-diacylglucosamine pyrophosphatase LpxH